MDKVIQFYQDWNTVVLMLIIGKKCIFLSSICSFLFILCSLWNSNAVFLFYFPPLWLEPPSPMTERQADPPSPNIFLYIFWLMFELWSFLILPSYVQCFGKWLKKCSPLSLLIHSCRAEVYWGFFFFFLNEILFISLDGRFAAQKAQTTIPPPLCFKLVRCSCWNSEHILVSHS